MFIKRHCKISTSLATKKNHDFHLVHLELLTPDNFDFLTTNVKNNIVGENVGEQKNSLALKL